MRVSRLWLWRGFGAGLLLAMLLMLVWLSGEARKLEQRAWEKTMLQLESKAKTLPSPQREELQGALLCMKLQREAGLLPTSRGGAFMRQARKALADGTLDAEEGRMLVAAARAACGRP